MTENLEDSVRAALQRLGGQAPDRPPDAARVRRTVRRRRVMLAGPVAVVVAVTGILAGVTLSRPDGHPAAGPAGTSACAPLQTGPIPVWARAGFTGNEYPPYATSSSGDLVAIVFGDPLSAPPAADHNNKILWVYRGGAPGDLDVVAHLEGTDRTVTKQIPAGPSIVDMPAAGCWKLDLTIGDRHDSIDLRWTRP